MLLNKGFPLRRASRYSVDALVDYQVLDAVVDPGCDQGQQGVTEKDEDNHHQFVMKLRSTSLSN